MNQSSSSSLLANSLADAKPANGLSLEANQSARSCSGATSGDGEGENLERSAAMADADENPGNFGGGASGFVGIDGAVWNPVVFVNTDLDFGLPLLSLDLAVDSMYAQIIRNEREFMTDHSLQTLHRPLVHSPSTPKRSLYSVFASIEV